MRGKFIHSAPFYYDTVAHKLPDAFTILTEDSEAVSDSGPLDATL